MDTVLIAARVALAGIFLVAAVAKLADLPGSRQAMADFNVPARLIPAVALALPLAELCAAVLLLPSSTARAGAVLAAALLLAFVAGIAAALRRGVAPQCHCFGQLHSRPAGHETIGRNAVLAAVALLIVSTGPGPTLGSWASDSTGERIALAAVSLGFALLAYAYVSVWQENRRLSGHGHGGGVPASLEPGEQAPDFAVTTPGRGKLDASEVLAGERAILVFTSATCGPCVGLLPELARWRQMLQGRLNIHVLASGAESENVQLAGEHGLDVLLDGDGRAARSFGILGTPSAIEIDEAGRVVTSPVAGSPAIQELIRAALKRPAAEAVVQVQQVAGTSTGAT